MYPNVGQTGMKNEVNRIIFSFAMVDGRLPHENKK
jgi:hypothetical protein